MLSNIFTVISLTIAFLSVCVSIYSIQQSHKTALNGVYFSEMTSAYAAYLQCVSEFVFRKGAPERDALATSLYRLLLFSPPEIGNDAQELYRFVLHWAKSGQERALVVDEMTNSLGERMKKHLESFRKTGGAL